jgi:hypothetical protein
VTRLSNSIYVFYMIQILHGANILPDYLLGTSIMYKVLLTNQIYYAKAFKAHEPHFNADKQPLATGTTVLL